MTPTYVVTDVEVDGPDPGGNSMMSFASVAIDDQGREVSTFEGVLAPLDGATPDADTIAWFKTHPDAYAAATAGPRPPAEVMKEFSQWVRALPGNAIFAAHPVAFDGLWIDYYLRRFAEARLVKGHWPGERVFWAGGLCIRSYASAILGWPLWQCDPDHYENAWLGDHIHTHRAIDDARGYACLLAMLMKRSPLHEGAG